MNDQERIEYFMAEIARLSNQVVDLQNERDALAAQNALLNAHLKRMQVFAAEYIIPNSCVGDSEFTKQMIYLLDGPEQRKAQATPAQCLAEIRANAIESAVTYLAESIPDESHESVIYKARYIYISNRYLREYAAKVRQGGE